MRDPKYPDILIANHGSTSDSANHTTYHNLMLLVLGESHVDSRYLFFDTATGLAKRHPDRELNNFTRDQLTPFIAYLALTLNSEHYKIEMSNEKVKQFYLLLLKNNGLFFNTYDTDKKLKPWYAVDWLDPQTRALWARATNTKRWMHYIGDLNLYATIRFNDAFRPNHNQDENIHCHLIVSKLVQPTFLTKWCWDYYFYKTKKDWKQKLVDFFDRKGTYYPEIPDIATKALEKLSGD